MFARIITSTGRNALKAQGRCALITPASFAKRCIATGDNDEVYIPTDVGQREYQYIDEMIYYPPGRTILEEKVVETVEETRWTQSLAAAFRVRFGQSMPTIHDDKAPERDLVNFPRPKRTIYPEATRLLVIPDSWFRAMYHKTGVTGPYCLTLGLLTFLFSKEWLIYEHEMNVGVHLAAIITFMVYKWGPLASRYLEGVIDSEEYYWNQYQKESIADLEDLIAFEKTAQDSLKNQGILFEAKRENVHLQREAEYRSRLMTVYQELKRKLDYQIASQEAGKQFAQRHLVSWILDSVHKNLGTVSEKETLNKCISDLKALSVARAGAI